MCKKSGLARIIAPERLGEGRSESPALCALPRACERQSQTFVSESACASTGPPQNCPPQISNAIPTQTLKRTFKRIKRGPRPELDGAGGRGGAGRGEVGRGGAELRGGGVAGGGRL